VLHGPVDTRFFTESADPPEDWFLVVSALVPYKRIDVAIQAAAIAGAQLKIVGTGPDDRRLRAIAKDAQANVAFLGAVHDGTLRDLYRRATALVLPGEEDFGIAPVESLACGRPVIALGRGGACETIDDGVTGRLVSEATPAAFAEAMREIAGRHYDAKTLRARAARFGADRFDAGFRAVLTETLTTRTEW
jgi:glycosyltransferase involved in cell wall biosynthesis